MISKIPSIYLCVIAGLLLWFSWPPGFLFFLSFFAFSFLFVAEEKLPPKHFFWHILLAMFIWNLGTTYWVFHATPFAIIAWVANSFLMTLPWLGYRKIKRAYGIRIGLIGFVGCWLAFEWLHFNWELAWPWLALGNVFAKIPDLVQWYEFTGTGGGTFWILLLNVLIYMIYRSTNKKNLSFVFLLILFLPVVISFLVQKSIKPEDGKEVNFLVVQPNENPYIQDHSIEENIQKLDKQLNLAKKNINAETDFIIYPEGIVPEYLWIEQLDRTPVISRYEELLNDTKHANIIIGADLLRLFEDENDITATARYQESADFYYDVYNASIFIRKGKSNQYYAKSKLVPGVERMPYPKYLKPLQKLAINLGGIGGSRATQKERTVFKGENAAIGTAICYESVFGDYMNDFVKNGAEILVIITNDGWWKNTSGYKQHFHYARLRAIESRRNIARSANTGISGFIDQKGKIISQTKWWEDTTISQQLKANHKITFYTKYGDYIYRVGLLISITLLLISLVKSKTKNFKYRV